MTIEATSAQGGWRTRIVRMGRTRALAAITLFSVAASVLVTALLMLALHVPRTAFAGGILIGAAVPLIVAPVASYAYLVLLYELEQAHARLAASVVRDSLTDIYNRRYLMERLATEIDKAARAASPLALLMIDVDGFKGINDAHGHPTGDRVLREIAQACAACLRPYDVLARFGGEEFAVLMADTPLDTAWEVAERIRGQVGALRIALDAHATVAATVSIGLGLLDARERTPTALIARADAALYTAKRNGRNRCAHVPAASLPAASPAG